MKHACLLAAMVFSGATAGFPAFGDPPADAPAATAPASAAKVPAPTGDALKESVKLVNAVFKDDLTAAKSPAQRGELSKKMLAAGREEKDPTGRYAILMMARDLAVETGEVETVRGVVEELDRGYVVDAGKLASDGALAASRNMRTAEQRRALADWCPELLEDAIDGDRYELARSIAEAYTTAARGVNDQAMQKEAMATAQRVRELEGAYNGVKKSMELLAIRMTDPEANLKVGRFHCFYKGDWKTGLPQLAASGDKTLSALAQAELAGPGEGDALVKLADGWWDAGASGSSMVKLQTQRHALEFYKAAQPKLTGLTKVRVDKRVKEAEAIPGVAKKSASGAELAKGDDDIAAKILAKIPKEMLPKKDDTQLDLRAKSSAVQNWIRKNRMVDPNGTSIAVTLGFEDCDVHTSSGRFPGEERQRLSLRLRENSTFQGVDCETRLSISRDIGGLEDPAYKEAKQMEKDGQGTKYTVVVPVTSLNMHFLWMGESRPPRVIILMHSQRGAYTVKAKAKPGT